MPYKDFAVGEVLTSADVDTYLMRQTVMVFDDNSARSSALGTVVTEGMITYRKDGDIVEQYNGSSWSAVGVDSFTTTGEAGQYLVSNGTAGVVWENSISPLLLLGV